MKTKRKASGSKKEKNDLSDLLKNISHDVRTPLNSIMGFSYLLSQKDTNAAKRDEYTGRIIRSGYKLLHVVDDLLELSMINSKDYQKSIRSCNLNELLKEISNDINGKFPDREALIKRPILEWDYHLQNMLIETDQDLLQKILSKLIEMILLNIQDSLIYVGFKIIDENQVTIYLRLESPGKEENYKENLMYILYQDPTKMKLLKEYAKLLGGHFNPTRSNNEVHFSIPMNEQQESIKTLKKEMS